MCRGPGRGTWPGPLQQHAAAGRQGVVHEPDGVANMGGQARGVLFEVAPGNLVGGQGQAVIDLRQDEVFFFQDHVELLAEYLGIEQVLRRSPIRAALSA